MGRLQVRRLTQLRLTDTTSSIRGWRGVGVPHFVTLAHRCRTSSFDTERGSWQAHKDTPLPGTVLDTLHCVRRSPLRFYFPCPCIQAVTWRELRC